MPQSAISAYESGRKQPSFAALVRLVEAAGVVFDVRLRLATEVVEPLTGPVCSKVQRRRSELRAALAEAGVRHPQVFGSVGRGDDRPGSDLDLLVDLPSGTGVLGLAAMRRRFSEIVGVPVDLVPREALRPRVATTIQPDLRDL